MEIALEECNHDFKEFHIIQLMDFLRFQAFFIMIAINKHHVIIKRSSNF